MQRTAYALVLNLSLTVAFGLFHEIWEEELNRSEEVRNKFPYICLVSVQGMECNGAIVTPRFALSVSHCSPKWTDIDTETEDNFIVAGTDNFNISSSTLNKTAQKRMIESYHKYSKLFDMFRGDIMLLKLDSDLTIDGNVATISLANLFIYPLKQQQSCVMVSFGNTFDSAEDDQRMVHIAPMTVEHPDRCFNWSEEFRRSHLCSRNTDTFTSCCGDSGAPLVCQGILVGLFSWHLTDDQENVCDNDAKILSFTYIGYYLPWIRTITRDVAVGRMILTDEFTQASLASHLQLLTAFIMPLLAIYCCRD